MVRKRRRVYLAGPISNCSPQQIHDWRTEVIDRWNHEFELVDPTEMMVESAAPFEVVRSDLEAIRSADAILSNMWKESIGTAIGVAHAARHGKPIVVVDPSKISSRMLAFFALAVVKTPHEGMRRIREYYRSQDRLRTVVKRGGREEPFDREHLVASIRRACRAAGKDDLLGPARIVPEVIARLIGEKRGPGRGKVTSRAILDAVWEVLRELEADPLGSDVFAGIREVWERRDADRHDRPHAASGDEVRILANPQRMRIDAGKSHTTIWGVNVKRLADIPREPRRLFREIARVEGIAEIRLTLMSQGPAESLDSVRAEILASREEDLIEGKCYHRADQGHIQMFQIRVHAPSRKEQIRLALIRHLAAEMLLRVPSAEVG